MIRKLLFITIATGVGILPVLAGTTGKIAGIVKDKQTGEELIGANIVIEGTSLGAATNIDGYYVILNIQPGKYTLVASAVGYNKVAINNVNVSIDLTTTIDIELTSTVVEVGEEVVVTAERPLVVQDLTAKTAVVGGDEIAALPVTEVGEVIELQAGFVSGSLRGGRSGEVAYWIDGVPITDAYNGQQVVEVNKDLVQELQVVSGAFNAEYGQAMSGIVNIATKEGGAHYTGGVSFYGGQYVTGDEAIFPGNNKFRPTSIRNYEANISGPVTGEDLTFFANGRYIYFDGWLKGFRRFTPQNIAYTDAAGTFQLYRDPSGRGDSAVVPMNSSERWYGQGKLTWRISPLIKLSANYIYDRTKSRPYDNIFNEDNRLYFYDPEGFGHDFNTSNTLILQLSHTLNQSTFYTLGASWFEKRFKYYLYENQFDPRYVHPKLAITDDSFSFQTGGTDLDWNQRLTRTILAKVDISSQLDQANLAKIGAEFRTHKVFLENITLQPVQEQSDINLATDSPFIHTRIPEI
jgi:CarboxypepD_reg-like domain/TonB-dependent Receptor Plug Domain